MVDEGFNILFHMGIARIDLRFHFLLVEQVGGPEFDLILHQLLIGLEYLHPEIDIQEKHGRKKAYDKKKQYSEHDSVVSGQLTVISGQQVDLK